MTEIVRRARRLGASDVHLAVGTRPAFRIDSALATTNLDPVTAEAMTGFLAELLPASRLAVLRRLQEVDLSVGRTGAGRLRVNAYVQRGTVALAIRLLPDRIRGLDDLGLPAGVVRRIVGSDSGLVLLTGPTGSGKSMTMAAIVEAIAATRACHIVTIEDPIEYVHRDAKGTVHQREVGTDTRSFASALRQVLRQDPDVIVIGEMRDRETVGAAMTAAETGQLVVATLHTPDAIHTINRIVDVFPERRHAQVRNQLSFTLNAVIAQRLVPRTGPGRALASETLVATAAVRRLVREGKLHQLYSAIQAGAADGMRTLSQSLAALVTCRAVRERDAERGVPNLEEFRRAIGAPGARRATALQR